MALQAGIVLFVARTVLEAGRIACAGIDLCKALCTSTGRRLLAPCFPRLKKRSIDTREWIAKDSGTHLHHEDETTYNIIGASVSTVCDVLKSCHP